MSGIRVVILSRLAWCVADAIERVNNVISCCGINDECAVYNCASCTVFRALKADPLIEVVILLLLACFVALPVDAIDGISIRSLNNGHKAIAVETRRASFRTLLALTRLSCG